MSRLVRRTVEVVETDAGAYWVLVTLADGPNSVTRRIAPEDGFASLDDAVAFAEKLDEWTSEQTIRLLAEAAQLFP